MGKTKNLQDEELFPAVFNAVFIFFFSDSSKQFDANGKNGRHQFSAEAHPGNYG